MSLDGLLAGMLGDSDHDLVVPTESALGFGNRQATLICNHFNYFKDTAVQAAIVKACPSAFEKDESL